MIASLQSVSLLRFLIDQQQHKRFILPGTKIQSDCWKAYSTLRDEGYLHDTVNHSVEFVSDSGTHTNTIESSWNALKKSLPRYGTSKELYNSYFAEYCVRKKYLDSANDRFVEFLKLISSVYKPPLPPASLPASQRQQTSLTTESAVHPTTVAQAASLTEGRLSPAAAASPTQTNGVRGCDIATLNLGFNIYMSSDDEMIDANSSADVSVK